ncbi:MAG TPA: multiheme c-type cytochrome [Pirellulales bacterium]
MSGYRWRVMPPEWKIARAIGLSAAIAVVAVAGWLAGNEPPSSSSAVSVEPVAKPSQSAPTAFFPLATKYIGVSGCTAAACHGDAISTDERLKWKSSYTVWASPELRGTAANRPGDARESAGLVDRHNRAYSVLFDERSKRIVQLLDGLPDVKSAAPHRDARCTACHSVPVDPKTAPTALLADGVGCELCHGPAKNWIREHTQINWLAGYHAGKSEPLPDMWDTHNLLSRAKICASCHVGDRPAGREVNHDFIAAGHPRLNFEFHAYLGVMPKHWCDAPSAKAGFRTDRESHAEIWAIGQLTAAEAALRLLAARAAAAEKESNSPERAPLPEFAEYDCYACHHTIDPKRPAAPRLDKFSEKKSPRLNSLPWTWGTWYFPDGELRLLLASDALAKSAEAKTAIDLIERLRTEMAKAAPDAAAVHAMASDAAGQLDRLAKRVDQIAFDARTIEGLLARAAAEDFTPADWDEVAQRFLTLEALWKAYQFANGQKPSGEQATEIAASLEQIRAKLEFPRPAKHSITGPDGKPVLSRIDSPTGFDPQAIARQFASTSTLIHKLLGVKEHP